MRFLEFVILLSTLVYFASAATEQNLPPGKGQEIVQRQCAGCHALKVVSSKRASKDQWSVLLDQMISKGAEIPDEDIETVVEYLSKNFPPPQEPATKEKNDDENKPLNVNKATVTELAAVLKLSPKEAAAIVAYREHNGDFKVWRDLTTVPGIDAKKIESNKDRIVF